ncbi:MAG: protein containing C-terminal region/beta chain of methionyl-tRNA synthetase [Candidatus Berkelbacteria bacterium Athens1014_28]|uniref:Protein containing C-terminal region/beta chain of methionyl-tRNA synthetase n=1 Tax=Candidatus Berkelbacteria bacterium Athens1014_28 TaxID=2017145 RepID=A0A554LLW9_9BACT|nr:MAG: protein containing C-terminal region/beta chain of methionyl-tRNA synthetase [Candidatus Berkelbacteria bacterium Athens1014_28]
MAKDILWFHGIIWPALLMALELPLPKKIFAHGFFTVDGNKMSKTRGNVLDPNKLVDKFGADAVRYAVLREFPFGEDGDISEEKIAARYENDLANGLGNLLQRTISMIIKYKFEIRNPKSETNPKSEIQISKLIEELKFDQALMEIWKIVGELNSYIDDNKPWELAKSDQKKLSEVLSFVFSNLSSLISPILPFMPETAEKMKKQLETLEPEPLFPRIEIK